MSEIKVSKKTIETIENYVSSTTAVKISNKIDALKNKKVTITNTGVVSSGKSSLFNALLGIKKDDENRFSVGAARTTMSKDIEKYSENIELIDTPGNEVEWLKKITINFNGDKNQLKDRFIFVNSWIDERMMENSYQSTIDETKRILFQTLGTEQMWKYIMHLLSCIQKALAKISKNLLMLVIY